MRRFVSVVSMAALASALYRPVALANLAVPTAYDFGSQVVMRLFGETTDSAAAVSAAYGDRTSESPLRSLALVVPEPARAAFTADIALAPTFARADASDSADRYGDLARTVRSRLLHSNVLYAPPAAPAASGVAPADMDVKGSDFPVVAYQPVESAPSTALASGDVSFEPLNVPEAAATTKTVAAPIHVGPVKFQGRIEGSSTTVSQLALNDSSYGAGANFDVRAGGRRVNVDVSSSYQQLNRNDVTFGTSLPTASLRLAGSDAPLMLPSYANMSQLSLAAGVNVPLINGLTLNLNYDTARLLGSYGLPGLTNLDAIDNAYGGGLTFALPHSSSTLSLSAYQYRYQDNILPANSLSQTRENLDFTVKF
ncbi:MAG: hypothetical protein JOY98_06145 [Candidatus Eremiobacteraeota bacterium]|nr:hypothetical protein [Candidatus Eremiobacteraeota bacterium]